MTKEIIESHPRTFADVEQSLALVHKGKRIITLDMEQYTPETLESVVGKPFEAAALNKEDALALAETVRQAIALARDSHLNPRDIDAALNTQRPAIEIRAGTTDVDADPSAEVSPFTALRDTISRVFGRGAHDEESDSPIHTDRLHEALTTWREAIAQRREALEILKEGLDGVYGEAEIALARRTSAQAGATALRHQKVFVERHAQTEAKIGSATETLVGRVVDAKQKEASLNTVKDLRDQLSSEYFRITRYLHDQATREGQLLERRLHEDASIRQLEEDSREIAQRIVALKRTAPDMTDSPVIHDEDGDEGANTLDIFTSEATADVEQLNPTDAHTIEKTRLVSAAEDELSACNDKLGGHRRNLVNIAAELDDIRDQTAAFIERERDLQRTILEDLVVPTLLATTPEIQTIVQKFNEMRTNQPAQYDQLPKLVKDYADAELWFNYEFAPQAVAQLKKMDPELYADFSTEDTHDGPVTTTQVRRFMSLIGIIILNRKDTFSTRIFQATQDYGTSVAQLAYDHANDGAQNNIDMMLDSSSFAYTNAVERKRLVEENSALSAELGRAIQDLDTYTKDVERAIDRTTLKLESVGFSMRTEYAYAQEVNTISQDYLDAQQATAAELAKAEAAEAQQRLLEEARRLDTRRLAGLELTSDGDQVREPSSENYSQTLHSNVVVLGAEASANTYAILANQLYERAWKKYDDLNAQSEITARLMSEFYEARIALLNELAQGAECGQETLEHAYASIEHTIQLHENLPVPGTLGEEEIHRRFLATNGREALKPGEQPMPAGYIERARRRGSAAIEWVRKTIK